MIDTKHNVISVNYTLFRDSEKGEMVETSEGKAPLVFLSGLGQMLPDFEINVSNLKAGDKFSFGIEAAKAYGTRNEEAIIELELNMFKKDGKLLDEVKVGNVLPLQDQEGRTHPARILELREETVQVDMNHPLADQDLYFTGNVVSVRDATADEISHGHVHGEGGHQH